MMRSRLQFISLATATLLFSFSPPLPSPHLFLPAQAQTSYDSKQTTNSRKVEADSLLKQGNEQYQINQFEAALRWWRQALSVYRSIKDRLGEGVVLGNLGLVYDALNNPKNAIEHHQQSLIILQEIQDRQREGNALNHLGNAYSSLNNFSKAIEYYQQSLAIAREIEDRQGEGNALGNLGGAYYSLEKFSKALEYYQQSLVIAHEVKNHQGERVSLFNIGIVYAALGDYSKAIQYYKKALVNLRESKDRQGEGSILGGLGNAYRAVGNYAKAIEYNEQHLAVSREIQDRQGESIALGNLGTTYIDLGNYTRAIKYHEQSLEIAKKIDDQKGIINSLNNLGNIYQLLGDHFRAMAYFGLSRGSMHSFQNRREYVISLIGSGISLESLGDYLGAMKYYQQGLEISKQIKYRLGEGSALGSLSSVYFTIGDYSKAIEFEEQSLAIARELKARKDEGESLNNLGGVLFKAGNLTMAERYLLDGISVWESIRQTGVGNNDANKVSIFEEQARTYRILQQVYIAQNQPKAALEIAERGRARAFVELLAQRIGNQRNQEPGVRSQESEVKPPTITQLQQIAKAQNASLVQYSIIYDDVKTQDGIRGRESELYIWVIQPAGEITFRKSDLKPLWQQQHASLKKLVEQSREAIGARGRSDVGIVASVEVLQQRRDKQLRNLKQLHQLLINPIADLLPKDPNQRVIFMPQGELFLVPFPALLDAKNTPLIEKHTISTAPSIQVLELTNRRRKGMGSREWGVGKSLVVGNPVMPKVQTEAGGETTQLTPLAGSEWEAKEIADLLKTKAIIGSQATKSNIFKQLSQARWIHFATHGLLDDFKGLGVPGAIALAPDNTGKVNDGLLTSDEILDLKLNAELVVLSACDTGRGRLTGDGVIGLSRSLITAGVPSIVVSLWKVPDQSTAFLMTEFYKNLQSNPDKAQALRQAMLSTKAKYPDPLDWAAFTLIGES